MMRPVDLMRQAEVDEDRTDVGADEGRGLVLGPVPAAAPKAGQPLLACHFMYFQQPELLA